MEHMLRHVVGSLWEDERRKRGPAFTMPLKLFTELILPRFKGSRFGGLVGPEFTCIHVRLNPNGDVATKLNVNTAEPGWLNALLKALGATAIVDVFERAPISESSQKLDKRNGLRAMYASPMPASIVSPLPAPLVYNPRAEQLMNEWHRHIVDKVAHAFGDAIDATVPDFMGNDELRFDELKWRSVAEMIRTKVKVRDLIARAIEETPAPGKLLLSDEYKAELNESLFQLVMTALKENHPHVMEHFVDQGMSVMSHMMAQIQSQIGSSVNAHKPPPPKKVSKPQDPLSFFEEDPSSYSNASQALSQDEIGMDFFSKLEEKVTALNPFQSKGKKAENATKAKSEAARNVEKQQLALEKTQQKAKGADLKAKHANDRVEESKARKDARAAQKAQKSSKDMLQSIMQATIGANANHFMARTNMVNKALGRAVPAPAAVNSSVPAQTKGPVPAQYVGMPLTVTTKGKTQFEAKTNDDDVPFLIPVVVEKVAPPPSSSSGSVKKVAEEEKVPAFVPVSHVKKVVEEEEKVPALVPVSHAKKVEEDEEKVPAFVPISHVKKSSAVDHFANRKAPTVSAVIPASVDPIEKSGYSKAVSALSQSTGSEDSSNPLVIYNQAPPEPTFVIKKTAATTSSFPPIHTSPPLEPIVLKTRKLSAQEATDMYGETHGRLLRFVLKHLVNIQNRFKSTPTLMLFSDALLTREGIQTADGALGMRTMPANSKVVGTLVLSAIPSISFTILVSN